jgi:hypothetical protein
MKMRYQFKKLFLYILLVTTITLTGCERDNRMEPKSNLSGNVVYNGQPVGVRSNGVQLELWQHGYQLFTKIQVHVAQDGSFAASVFDGNYKLVRLRGNGPWVDNTDSIDVAVRGNTVIDVPVQPYFILKNETFSKGEGKVTATFSLDQITQNRDLERVNLYLGTTSIIDQNNNVQNAQLLASAIEDPTQSIALSANLPANLSNRSYVYARIGIKTVGVGEMLFGKVQKIELK